MRRSSFSVFDAKVVYRLAQANGRLSLGIDTLPLHLKYYTPIPMPSGISLLA